MQLYLYAKRYACFLTLLGFIKIFLKIANDRFLVQQERGLQCTHAYELFLEYNFDLGLNKFPCWDGYQRQCQKMYLSFLRGPRLFSDRCSRRLVAIVWIHRATENFDKTLCSGISPVQARCIYAINRVRNRRNSTVESSRNWFLTLEATAIFDGPTVWCPTWCLPTFETSTDRDTHTRYLLYT